MKRPEQPKNSVKTKINGLCGLLSLLVLGQAHASDLRLYPSFSEVRQAVSTDSTTLKIRLPQKAWQGILAGSIELEGLPFNAMQQSLEANWLSALEGKKVYLKRGEADAQQVTLVRAQDLLVKNSAGRFLNVKYDELQFEQQPPENASSSSRSLSFLLPRAGKGTLSYLSRSLHWTPRYTLRADAKGTSLSALADIYNDSPLEYRVENSELYAGDVNISNPEIERSSARVAYDAAPMAMKVAPQIESGGELQGLYRYKLNSSFELPANSVITLPFLTPKVSKFERYALLNSYFSSSNSEGNMVRAYRLQADQQLPAGAITIREENRLVGQSNINNTRKNGQIELILGQDPDIYYKRNVKVVRQDKNLLGDIVSSTYKVTFELENAKDRPVNVKISERLNGQNIIVNNQKPVKNNAQAELELKLEAKGRSIASYSVTIENK